MRLVRPFLLLGALSSACGGRAERVGMVLDAGAQGGAAGTDGGSAGNGASSGAGIASGGTGAGGASAGRGGVAAGSGGTGLEDSGTSVAGAPATEMSTSFGDYDHIPDGLMPPAGGSAFIWGLPADVHIGNWFVVSPSGVVHDARIDAIEPPRGDSEKACHASGSEFADGVDLYAQLNHPSNQPADLGRYAGLAFWARLTASGAKLVVVLNDGTGSLLSEGSFSGLPSDSFAATEQWQRFELPFTDPARTSAVVSLDFVVTGGGEALDLWIDDIELLCRGACL